MYHNIIGCHKDTRSPLLFCVIVESLLNCAKAQSLIISFQLNVLMGCTHTHRVPGTHLRRAGEWDWRSWPPETWGSHSIAERRLDGPQLSRRWPSPLGPPPPLMVVVPRQSLCPVAATTRPRTDRSVPVGGEGCEWPRRMASLKSRKKTRWRRPLCVVAAASEHGCPASDWRVTFTTRIVFGGHYL